MRSLGRLRQISSLLQELDERHRGGQMADPEKEHPSDYFGFVIGHLGAEFGAMALLMTGNFMGEE